MIGINETKDVLKFLAQFGNGMSNALEDGDIDFLDISDFIPALLALGPAVMGLETVPSEILDITDDERIELVDFVVSELDISSERVEEFVEEGLKAVFQLLEFVSLFYINDDENEE